MTNIEIIAEKILSGSINEDEALNELNNLWLRQYNELAIQFTELQDQIREFLDE